MLVKKPLFSFLLSIPRAFGSLGSFEGTSRGSSTQAPTAEGWVGGGSCIVRSFGCGRRRIVIGVSYSYSVMPQAASKRGCCCCWHDECSRTTSVVAVQHQRRREPHAPGDADEGAPEYIIIRTINRFRSGPFWNFGAMAEVLYVACVHRLDEYRKQHCWLLVFAMADLLDVVGGWCKRQKSFLVLFSC